MNLSLFKNKLYVVIMLVVASASVALADTYRVTVQNITANQTFTGIYASIHGNRRRLFQTGELLPESSLSFFQSGLIRLEPENISISPGETLTLFVDGRKKERLFSLISPLHATDDGFMGIDSIPLPTRRRKVTTIWANAYDAGLFDNTESCQIDTVLTSLRPPEECSQTPKDVILQRNHPVITHSGIHGIGDLSPAKYDWKNPVAKVTIQKTSK